MGRCIIEDTGLRRREGPQGPFWLLLLFAYEIWGLLSLDLLNSPASALGIVEAMSRVIKKFFIASMVMWIAPVAILYGFNNHIFPGTSQLSSSSQTLVSGFLAVISVNLVIVLYIIMAMKEPGSNREHQPDPAFLAEAKASIKQPAAVTTDDNAQTREKAE
ncbi:hypothetical protein OPV22_028667 [Ensete ventricosum]|uniref:Vacuolar ATPase assembly integral membrane protein VMA21 homolog n=1 Tax=Ensete ventricosum TaxID=4639 RepID=A0AAV8QB51_ENSVE|nr:hypothetical protein OPV22_028667 [Ensete ventricosum]